MVDQDAKNIYYYNIMFIQVPVDIYVIGVEEMVDLDAKNIYNFNIMFIQVPVDIYAIGFEEMVDLDAKNIVNASKENGKGNYTKIQINKIKIKSNLNLHNCQMLKDFK